MAQALIEQRPAALPVPVRPAPSRRLVQEIRGPWRLAMAAIVVFFGLSGGFAATARLSGAVIASGMLSPEGSRQTVQHLEGGIIGRILVKEGDRVAGGQALIELQDVVSQADVKALRSELRSIATQLARAHAAREDRNAISFDDPVLNDREDPEIALLIEAETKQFDAKRSNERMRVDILNERLVQDQRKIDGFERQLEGVRAQAGYLREELATVKDIVKQGLERKPRLLQLLRTEAAAVAQEGALMSSIAETEAAMAETRLQIAAIRLQRLEETDTLIDQYRSRRREVEETLRKAEDRAVRSVISAPVAGRVFGLKFKTVGGVVRPGEPILDIVPDKDNLVVDARVRATDIDEVRPGQEAHIIFPTFPQRHLQRIPGEVAYVSADSLSDERTGVRYYDAKISLDREKLNKIAPNAVLEPGMPAEVFLATGERTILDYLTQPIRLSLSRAMREQ